MLTSAFTKAEAPTPEAFARIVVDGDEKWGHGTDLVIVDARRCASLAVFMNNFVVADIIGEYRSNQRIPVEPWQQESLVQNLQELTQELQELINCYCLAARMGHPILTGLS
ncbi:MAG: hypothetical protein AAFQ89_01005 [Cyanobacteria bacterium J06626_18]